MTVTDAAEHDVARLLDARIGLRSHDSGRPRLSRALRDLAADRDVDPASLSAALVLDATLLDDLIDRITVQETGFFRHPDQFERLARVVLPTLNSSTVLAWSAASANGQEAYSLAIVFAEAGRACSVLASDVSPAAIQRTDQGWYGPSEMTGVSTARRHQHFHPDGTGWRVNPALRDSVAPQHHNLLDPIPPHVSACHVVMCRNVLIYLDRRHAESFLDRLADAMDPSAYLFVGGAETLWQITDRFEPTPLGTCYAYRPRPRPHARAAPGARAATARQTVVGTVPAGSVSSPRTPRPATHLPHLEVARSMETDPDATGGDRQRRGQELLAAGAVAEAIVVLRQWSYECPDDPLAHFQMGVALDRHGDGPSARRAYRAALGALDRLVPGRRVELLEGFSEAALRDLLNDRSGVDGRRRPVGGSP